MDREWPPQDHVDVELPQIDVVFVGSTTEPVHWQRMPLLEALQSRYSVLARKRVYGEAM